MTNPQARASHTRPLTFAGTASSTPGTSRQRSPSNTHARRSRVAPTQPPASTRRRRFGSQPICRSRPAGGPFASDARRSHRAPAPAQGQRPGRSVRRGRRGAVVAPARHDEGVALRVDRDRGAADAADRVGRERGHHGHVALHPDVEHGGPGREEAPVGVAAADEDRARTTRVPHRRGADGEHRDPDETEGTTRPVSVSSAEGAPRGCRPRASRRGTGSAAWQGRRRR